MRYWIVSWDCNGVEYLEDITDQHPDNWAKRNLLKSIKESKVVHEKTTVNINLLLFRARFNAQRFYEIYIFTADEGIGYEELQGWFNTDPQGFADWVRVNHVKKIFDGRAHEKPKIF